MASFVRSSSVVAVFRRQIWPPFHPWTRFCSSEAAAHPLPKGFNVADFLKSVGQGVETHIAKIEQVTPTLEELILVRTKELKKAGIPCKQRKLVLRFAEKYRQGLWRPKAHLS